MGACNSRTVAPRPHRLTTRHEADLHARPRSAAPPGGATDRVAGARGRINREFSTRYLQRADLGERETRIIGVSHTSSERPHETGPAYVPLVIRPPARQEHPSAPSSVGTPIGGEDSEEAPEFSSYRARRSASSRVGSGRRCGVPLRGRGRRDTPPGSLPSDPASDSVRPGQKTSGPAPSSTPLHGSPARRCGFRPEEEH